MKVFPALTKDKLEELNKIIDSQELVDGGATAKGHAAKLKKNLQLTADHPGFKLILPYVYSIMLNEQIKAYTFFRKLLSPRIAVYRGQDGGRYDWHVDAAIMDNERADLSFTVFLNDREDYEGGEMQIQLPGGMKATAKGKAGEIIIYPSGLLHQVNPVTNGERRVIVGWINSNIKLHEYRERIYEFNVERTRLEKKYGYDEIENINRMYHLIVRDFSGQ